MQGRTNEDPSKIFTKPSCSKQNKSVGELVIFHDSLAARTHATIDMSRIVTAAFGIKDIDKVPGSGGRGSYQLTSSTILALT